MSRKRKWTWSVAGGVLLAALFGLWQLSTSRSFQLFGTIVPRVDIQEKAVALTFDDGPSPQYAPYVLDLLKKKGVTATFFLLGSQIDLHPAAARAIALDGHEIGNHTYNHHNTALVSGETAKREVERTDAAIRRTGYKGEILFRPPYCKKFIALPLYLARHNRITVTWDVEPESYSEVASDPVRIAAHVLANVRPGSIVLLHVMAGSRENTRAALPQIIDGLRARGYRFVTVSELMALAKR